MQRPGPTRHRRGVDLAELTDDDLLRRGRVDPGVFAVLYDRHAVAVHAHLRRRVGAAVAEELLGEVFLGAIAARGRVVPHGSGSALPWLYGIAGNLLRAHARRARAAAELVRAGPDPTGPGAGDAGTDWDAVDDRLDADARRAELRLVLSGLTDAERDVLLLVAWEGLSPAEAGVALGLSPVAARTRLLRARTRARSLLTARRPVGPSKERTR